MTREEFINWFEERFALTKNDIYEFGQLYDEATKPQWISVIDETPPQNKAYLAYWQHYGVTKYRYVKARAKVSRTFSGHITHWMPLPEAPLVTDLNKKDLPPVSCQEGNILVEEKGGEE